MKKDLKAIKEITKPYCVTMISSKAALYFACLLKKFELSVKVIL